MVKTEILLKLILGLNKVGDPFYPITPYDGEHLTARFSVSTGVKKENSMRIKVRKNIKRIIEVYPSKYFIAKFASK